MWNKIANRNVINPQSSIENRRQPPIGKQTNNSRMTLRRWTSISRAWDEALRRHWFTIQENGCSSELSPSDWNNNQMRLCFSNSLIVSLRNNLKTAMSAAMIVMSCFRAIRLFRSLWRARLPGETLRRSDTHCGSWPTLSKASAKSVDILRCNKVKVFRETFQQSAEFFPILKCCKWTCSQVLRVV